MADINYNQNEIVQLIGAHLNSIGVESPYKIVVAEEQAFLGVDQYDENTICIVVRFLSAELQFGQIVAPVMINCISEVGGLDIAKNLLIEFAQQFNRNANTSSGITEFYNTPVVTSNFNEFGIGKRSLLYLDATYLIAKGTNNVDHIAYNNEDINCLSVELGFNIDLDTQSMQNGSISKSRGKVGTVTLSVLFYENNSTLVSELREMIWNTQVGDIDKTYALTIVYKDGSTYNASMRIASVNASVQIGSLGVIQVVFTM